MRTLVIWLKATLLLKLECFHTNIYMKHNAYKQTHNFVGKQNVWEAVGVRNRVGIN
jgi:hypothetical protein